MNEGHSLVGKQDMHMEGYTGKRGACLEEEKVEFSGKTGRFLRRGNTVQTLEKEEDPIAGLSQCSSLVNPQCCAESHTVMLSRSQDLWAPGTRSLSKNVSKVSGHGFLI